MSYTYLSLTNDVLRRVNETPLTSGNFASAGGVFADAKYAVNLSINDINVRQFEWPFNHSTKTLVLTPDVVRYNYEANTKSISFDTFRIVGSGNIATTYLFPMDYEDYLNKYSDMEYNPTNYASIPSNVFRTREEKFGIVPPPDEAYTLEYEWYAFPLDLEDHDDVPTAPEPFKHAIHNGAMRYAYMFRGDLEAAALQETLFDKEVEKMRSIYINNPNFARSTFIRR